MKRWVLKSAVAMSAAVGVSAFSNAAQAEPDLVIQAADSKVEFVGCEEGQPLAEGRIVIRNEGDSVANLRGANEFFRSFVAVYVPENIDLIDKDTRRSKIEPGEQRAITFSLGKDKVKKGRNYNGFAVSAAHLTLDTHLRLGSRSSDRCISCTRIIELLVFLMSPTLGRSGAAMGTKCRRRNTSRIETLIYEKLWTAALSFFGIGPPFFISWLPIRPAAWRPL
jgi:hypothetical protein